MARYPDGNRGHKPIYRLHARIEFCMNLQTARFKVTVLLVLLFAVTYLDRVCISARMLNVVIGMQLTSSCSARL
jgi:hypothetical protein